MIRKDIHFLKEEEDEDMPRDILSPDAVIRDRLH